MSYTIKDTAQVHDSAELGVGTTVWELAQVREGARLGEGCHLERELADSLLFDRVDSPRLDIRQIRTSTGFAHEFASVVFELVDTCIDSREVAGSLAMNA